MLSAAARATLIAQYRMGPERLAAALARVPEEARRWRPAPGEWSVHEVIIHCADAEAIGAGRIRFLLAEPEPAIIGYAEDRWASRLDYHALPLAPALATIAAVRANTAPLLERLGDADWSRAGQHSASGRYSAEDWLQIYGEHLELHTAQIENNLSAWQSRATIAPE